MTVLLVFTIVKYSLLTLYDGRYTSRGPNGNQPTVPLPPLEPTKATSAGAYTGRVLAGPGTQAQDCPT